MRLARPDSRFPSDVTTYFPLVMIWIEGDAAHRRSVEQPAPGVTAEHGRGLLYPFVRENGERCHVAHGDTLVSDRACGAVVLAADSSALVSQARWRCRSVLKIGS